jgi:hypothetical protein
MIYMLEFDNETTRFEDEESVMKCLVNHMSYMEARASIVYSVDEWGNMVEAWQGTDFYDAYRQKNRIVV